MPRVESDEFDRVKRLVADGLSDYQVARRTGVPRSTVQRWPTRAGAPNRRRASQPWKLVDAPACCYLLGMYLGDGCVVHRPPNAWTLRISCDDQYPGIMDEVGGAMEAVFLGSHAVRWHPSDGASSVVAVSHLGVGGAFPQHGLGRKHDRLIELAAWQRQLTHRCPQKFIRGLLQSDGCRCINRFKTTLPSGRVAEYAYARYFFTNYSDDIRRIFAEHCELIGVKVTRSSSRNLSISHRQSVAIVDTFVGPKR